ncbi:Tyrosine recombinase XerD [Arthrobacter sp. Bi83]|uniref:site-specific integrase n=1 Tax=Arthrobacter sp. Bi83 TaxID=2822353 RepID=UPI001D5663C5|nr:site-specific integrase [Arthrobacter sp. Bi83]CAH0127144.1 Tyrosine recombinase XerD [Arthrobacter sp. Bi83]
MPWSVQRVIQPDGEESWTVTDPSYDVVAPVDRFLAHLGAVDRSPGTVRSYAFDLRDFFTFLEQSQVRWRDVQLEDLGRFANWLSLAPAERSGQLRHLTNRAEHCSATTINRKLSAVGSFYQFHQQHGAAFEFMPLTGRRGRSGAWKPLLAHLGGSARPGKELKRRTPARTPRTLNPGQVSAVLDACDHLRDRLLFGLLAGSGMRIGEALGLRHEDIDSAACIVRVRSRRNANNARAKTGDRDIPVQAGLVRIFADYLFDEYGTLDCDYVFVNLWSEPVGRPMTYQAVLDLVSRLRARTGFHFTPHQFRHTYATDLLRRNVPSEVVQKLLGHSSVATTIDTYSHLDIRHVRKALASAGWLPDNPEADGDTFGPNKKGDG